MQPDLYVKTFIYSPGVSLRKCKKRGGGKRQSWQLMQTLPPRTCMCFDTHRNGLHYCDLYLRGVKLAARRPDTSHAGQAHPGSIKAKIVAIRHNMSCEAIKFDTHALSEHFDTPFPDDALNPPFQSI